MDLRLGHVNANSVVGGMVIKCTDDSSVRRKHKIDSSDDIGSRKKRSEGIRDEAKPNNGSGGWNVSKVSDSGPYDEICNSSSNGSSANSFSTSVTRSQKQYKYICKDLDMATKMCIIIETAIGMKKERVKKIHDIVEGLSKRKSKLNKDIKTYIFPESKDTRLSVDKFRLKCYLSYSIADIIDERSHIKKQIFDFETEIQRLNDEINEHEKMFKTWVYKKEQILKYFNNR